MYKKITHEIVEEHFDHPMALPANMRGEAPAPVVASGQLPMFVMNENTMMFRMDSRTMWSKYAWGLLNYGIALNANLPSTDQVEGRMIKNGLALGEFVVPYYGVTAGEQLGEYLAGIGQTGINAVKAIKEDKSLDTINSIWESQIDVLSKYMNELNPTNWPAPTVKDYFTNLVKFWSDALRAQSKGDTLADEIAIDRINKLVVLGIKNSVPTHKSSSLADVFSRGMIAQFPSLFAE